MLNPVMYGYKQNQRASQRIAEALGCGWHYPGSGYEWKEDDLIVNWGNGSPLRVPQRAHILNKYRAICRSVNKAETFEYLQNAGVSIPPRTTIRNIAKQWIEQGEIVFCRQTLTGCNGEGIEVARLVEDLVDAPMYTKYVNNDREFRVHVFNGEYIFATEKKADTEAFNPDPMVKSGENWCMGWVDNLPPGLANESIKAIAALGLDFGAVDIGYIESTFGNDDGYWVFETNTAPGAFGPRTLAAYVKAIRKACV